MSDRLRLGRALAPVGLVALLAAAWLVPSPAGLRLSSADDGPMRAWRTALDALPEAPTLLVGFDPDVGTYSEIRATVRAALADLLNRDARLGFVSLTVEGRALLVAELERLARLDANQARVLDLGYRPGAEAALVALARDPGVGDDAEGELPRRLAAEGMAAVDGILVVGGNDMGPRSWIEQVRPRVDEVQFLAIAPTVLLPELQPYVQSGQLTALIGTPRDGAAYRGDVDLGPLERMREEPEPSAVALAIGMLAAIAVLGHAWGGRLAGQLREAGRDGRDGG